MEIKRDVYLKRLIVRKHNGFIKVITGIRRSGKSYLLNTLFYNHLLSEGIKPDHIIRFAFDTFDKTADSFKKLIVVEKRMKPRYDDKGYPVMGVKEFLLDKDSLPV